ncbi:MAG TPA: GNAT family N-acetyltransferase [Bryobacteraceae bacterium]|nr:GNAT family N-acetyltransferase [Bryobacteraceae bacterium]
MSSKPSEEFRVRGATVADAGTIIKHRRAMFFDMGRRDEAWLDGVAAAFLPWLLNKLENGEYLGWFAVAPDRSIAAGAGLWLLDWFPHRPDRSGLRGYLLNVYTEPAYRRRGLARQLVEITLYYCRQQGIDIATLHASEEGRPLYESLGFEATNEMRIGL